MIDKVNKVNNKVKNRMSKMELKYTCSDCGEDVSITLSEILHLDDSGLCVSTRCENCRKEKAEKFEKLM